MSNAYTTEADADRSVAAISRGGVARSHGTANHSDHAGVSDLARAKGFYQALGLILWGRDKLAKDCDCPWRERVAAPEQ